jgi:hypothetical protein
MESDELAARVGAITESEESLREARGERMKAVSVEALNDLDSYTVKIVARRKQGSGLRSN